ncbi:MAG TPA: hypothetical protein VMK12_15470 [Anaeromyxobacteraceae bacterium]|nr:hypothetical protein [Anaeromyxobacteraceae bacterium]
MPVVGRRVLARRLFFIAFWPCLALAVLAPGYHALVYVHDRFVVDQDFECFRRELARELTAERAEAHGDRRALDVLWSSEAGAKCHVRLVGDDPNPLNVYSTRAWEADLMREPPNPLAREFGRRALYLSALSILPVVAVILIRRWPRRLRKPPSGRSPTAT